MPDKPECFIIMPISDPNGYDKDHFRRVFKGIFEPACEKAGYKARRADMSSDSNLIHEKVLSDLLEAPMAICDLTSGNPNVLFELGFRQAFDKPVVLVQEQGSGRIFDVQPLRAIDYHKELRFDTVDNDIEEISKALTETKESHEGGKAVHSLVKLLKIRSAFEESETEIGRDEVMEVMMAKIDAIHDELTSEQKTVGTDKPRTPITKALASIDDLFYHFITEDISVTITDIRDDLSILESELEDGLEVTPLDMKYFRLRIEIAKRKASRGNIFDDYSDQFEDLDVTLLRLEQQYLPNGDDGQDGT